MAEGVVVGQEAGVRYQTQSLEHFAGIGIKVKAAKDHGPGTGAGNHRTVPIRLYDSCPSGAAGQGLLQVAGKSA